MLLLFNDILRSYHHALHIPVVTAKWLDAVSSVTSPKHILMWLFLQLITRVPFTVCKSMVLAAHRAFQGHLGKKCLLFIISVVFSYHCPRLRQAAEFPKFFCMLLQVMVFGSA
jgi:hypothetical protein